MERNMCDEDNEKTSFHHPRPTISDLVNAATILDSYERNYQKLQGHHTQSFPNLQSLDRNDNHKHQQIYQYSQGVYDRFCKYNNYYHYGMSQDYCRPYSHSYYQEPILTSPPSCHSGSSVQKSEEDTYQTIFGEDDKPPFSYAQMIIQAIHESPSKRLTLSEIYSFISSKYPYFNLHNKGWQNSIRHNLSLNRYFVKEYRKDLDSGKGSYWTVDSDSYDKLVTNAYKKRRQRDNVTHVCLGQFLAYLHSSNDQSKKYHPKRHTSLNYTERDRNNFLPDNLPETGSPVPELSMISTTNRCEENMQSNTSSVGCVTSPSEHYRDDEIIKFINGNIFPVYTHTFNWHMCPDNR